MAPVSRFRLPAGQILLAVVLTLAMPAQWEAFCGGWQSPQQAMACCAHASHDVERSVASSCCLSQEQARHAQSPLIAMPTIRLVPAHLPVPAAAPARFYDESPRRARSGDARLLAAVFLI